MTTNRKFKSDAFEAIHSSASALQRVRAIDEDAMREFDVMRVTTPANLEPRQIENIRGQES
jgi:putative transcriptional regulator